MPKLDRSCLQRVQEALERYRQEVESTELQPTTKKTYLTHAENFVRWLDDDFEPGVVLKRS